MPEHDPGPQAPPPHHFALRPLAAFSFLIALLYVNLFTTYFQVSVLTARNLAVVGGFAALGAAALWGIRQPAVIRAFERLAAWLADLRANGHAALVALLMLAGSLGAFAARFYLLRPSPNLPAQYLPLLAFGVGICLLGAAFAIRYGPPAAGGWLWVAMALNAIYLGFLAFHGAGGSQPVLADDTPNYLGGSSLGYLFDRNLWFGFRPFSVPLVLTLVGNQFQAFVAVQGLLHAIAWSVLAWALSLRLQSLLAKSVGFIGVLLLSLAPQVHAWNHIVLSEALSMTFMVLLLGLLLLLKPGSGRWAFVGLFAVALLWLGTRDSNLFSLILVGVLLLIYANLGERAARRHLLLAAIGFLGVAAIGYAVIQIVARDVYFATITLHARVLSDPARLDFFQSHGLPELDDPESKHDLLNLPADSAYQRWAADHLVPTFTKLLLAEFPASALEPFQTTFFPPAYNGQNLWGDSGYQPILGQALLDQIEFEQWSVSRALVFGLAGFAALYGTVKRRHVLGGAGIVLLLISIPSFILTWHGDPGELERHALIAGLQFKLGILLTLLTGIDLAAMVRSKPVFKA